MNTYTPGQKVVINSPQYAADLEEHGVGIPLGAIGTYESFAGSDRTYPHNVRYQGDLHPLAGREVSAA